MTSCRYRGRAAPCHEDSCTPERTTCRLYVQEHVANVELLIAMKMLRLATVDICLTGLLELTAQKQAEN